MQLSAATVSSVLIHYIIPGLPILAAVKEYKERERAS